jgi:hypothetical protein
MQSGRKRPGVEPQCFARVSGASSPAIVPISPKEDIMDSVTIDDRKKELRTLLDLIQTSPSRDWTDERARVVVLQRMIAADEAHKTHA